MKTTPLLLLAALLLCGCSSSEGITSTTPHFSDLPTASPQPSQLPAPAAQRGEAPPLIYISGEFKKPGCYPWTNGMTLKDAFATAGGFTDFAQKRIRLEHWDRSLEFYRWSLKRPLTNNPPLRLGDNVMNPRE